MTTKTVMKEPLRKQPMPPRHALGIAEKSMIAEVIAWYQERGADPGYQGHFEELFCDTFVQMMGGGYADAVATGTAALFVALAALNLPKNSEVLVSPITDPGTLSAIILSGLKPKLLDTKENSFNTGLEQIKTRLDDKTSCVLLVHAAGQPIIAMDEIVKFCHQRGVKVLEDCSQAHGAKSAGKLIGTFGDIAAFSTMYRKASVMGPTGGVVYTSDESLYFNALAHADRGKPIWQKDFDDRNPTQFLFPALNLHSNEIACGIGLASLKRLPQTISKRITFLKSLTEQLTKKSQVCKPYGVSDDDSPFFYPIFVDRNRINTTKTEFAKAVRAEGISLNPHYRYLVSDWPWIRSYLVDDFQCENARRVLDVVFCLYLNEHYGQQEVADIVAAIVKVENYYA